MMPNILLIDDDQVLCKLLSGYLENSGYHVRIAHNGQLGMREIFAKHPDLVLLDVAMPRKDGWQTLKSIRELTDLPVIMLTARDNEPDILRGFSLGTDDYITKPFSFAELVARIQAVLNRSNTGSTGERFSDGDLNLDINTRRVTRDGQIIKLTPTEFNLLAVLMRQTGEILSPEELVRKVWGVQYAEEVGHVRRYIWHLRQKIERDPENPQYIHNERGFGYYVKVNDA
jgi:two-component system KDP operon response regulator KdpE